MTLRVRLLSVTAAMVAIVAATLTGLSLSSITEASLETAASSSEGAAGEIQSFLLRRLGSASGGSAPSTPARASWDRLLADDTDLAAILEQTMAQSRAIVEINVANRAGVTLASSNPRRRFLPLARRPDLRVLRDHGALLRLQALLAGHEDYETRVSLGVKGDPAPLLVVQVLVSPVLLRAATLPRLRDLAIASAAAFILALGLAFFSANLALRPLARIAHLIDDIAVGKPIQQPPGRHDSPELALIESKLSLLGEQFRGARADASQLRTDLDGALQQLDAGSRASLEAQIALARRLTAINSLTRGVAHEIKNPLNSIALRLEMLRDRIAEDSPGAEDEFAILTEEIVRLDRVVRTFLDFNRPVELNLADLDISADIARMLDLLEPDARFRGITVHLHHPAQPAIVKADAGLLRQALLNIAVNAIEAMEHGGRLDIHVTRDAGLCGIQLADTGPGIPPAHLERIFELYFTTKTSGTGIGLAMAFRAVHLHGGTIGVESEMGKGTVFEVKLPLAAPERLP